MTLYYQGKPFHEERKQRLLRYQAAAGIAPCNEETHRTFEKGRKGGENERPQVAVSGEKEPLDDQQPRIARTSEDCADAPEVHERQQEPKVAEEIEECGDATPSHPHRRHRRHHFKRRTTSDSGGEQHSARQCRHKASGSGSLHNGDGDNGRSRDNRLNKRRTSTAERRTWQRIAVIAMFTAVAACLACRMFSFDSWRSELGESDSEDGD